MRRFAPWIFALLLVGRIAGAQPSRDHARARELIAQLRLEPLAGESGYFAFLGASAQTVTTTDGGATLPAQSRIYYLLTRDKSLNYLHWLASDDTHILLEGGPVDYYIFHPDGRAEMITLGRDLALGQQLVVAIPGGCWKALRLHDGAGYALMVNVLSPAWAPDRVKIGAGEGFLRRYTGSAPWATKTFLRELIGPNAKP